MSIYIVGFVHTRWFVQTYWSENKIAQYVSGFRGHSTTAQLANQKTPTRRKTPQVSSSDALASEVIPVLLRLMLKETERERVEWNILYSQLCRSDFLTWIKTHCSLLQHNSNQGQSQVNVSSSEVTVSLSDKQFSNHKRKTLFLHFTVFIIMIIIIVVVLLLLLFCCYYIVSLHTKKVMLLFYILFRHRLWALAL